MDNIYSLFYTGQQNPYGIGTWDSRGHKMKHSSSQPFLTNNSNKYHTSINDPKKRDSNIDNLKLPLINSRPSTHYRHHTKKSRKKYNTNSSIESSSQYDVNKNRKELSNFVKDINNSIAVRLQNDNFLAQQKLNNIKNNYNEIKNLLNNKIEKLEHDQQMQFNNLKYALEQGGGLKMMGAVRNANGGNNYDLQRAEEEDMIDATRKLPKILEDKIRKYDQEISDSEVYIKKLKKENEWIESEMNFFGMKGTDYDFSKLNIKEEYKKLEKLKEDNSVLKRKVNMKVESMADQYDKEYSNLIKKKDIIFKDKLNIQRAIEDLDKKRKEALEKVFSLASDSLNKIYKTLLPGTMAKLEQIDKYDLMKGVHLKVAFNGVWKKSLAELSGGQSSLLALSLILALLRYKPAPIYIFDEIDAALDLSHTANLGLMLKQEFPESQFVVISLKDGMFSNANVLYRVSYVDGSSKVERLTKSTI